MRGFRNRILAHIWLLLALAGVAIGLAATEVSLAIGQELLAPVARDLLPEDQGGLRAYADGLRRLDEGKLSDALTSFEVVRNASAPVLVAAANKAKGQVEYLLAIPPFLRASALHFAEWPLASRWLAAACSFLSALIFASIWLGRFALRPGCELGQLAMLASGTPVDAMAAARFLHRRLDHIGFRLQRPAGLGGAIGPVLAVNSLLPSSGTPSPLADTLASLDDLANRGGVPFALGQVKRALGLLRRRRRYQITGFVQLSDREVRVSADLMDLREKRALAHISASSAELDRYATSPRHPRSVDPSTLTSNALNILAHKIWHALAEAARPGLRPSSWVTLVRFTAGLDFLSEAEAEVGGSRSAQSACRAFDSIVEELDPPYLPARFYRSYANILIGDLNSAAAEFTAMTKRVEETASASVRALVSRWLQYRPRWRLLKLFRGLRSKLVKAGRFGKAAAGPLENVESAVKWWRDISIATIGGELYNMVKSWSQFDDRKRGWEVVFTDPPLQLMLKRSYLQSFGEGGYIHRLVETVLGMREDDLPPEEAKQRLDGLLDLRAIRAFDHKLHLLEIRLGTLPIVSAGDALLRRSEQSLDEARAGVMGLVFKEKLDSIADMISKQAYAEAKQTVLEIRSETRPPSLNDAAVSIMFGNNAQFGSGLAKLVVPALGHIDKYRQVIVTDRFYLESRYYRAIALYQSFSFTELQLVVAEKNDYWLRSYFGEPLDSKEQSHELVCLFHCLLITAAARVACVDIWQALDPIRISPVVFASSTTWDPELKEQVDRAKDSARYEASELIERLGSALPSWRRSGSNRLKAASASAMAHWARVQRERSEESEIFISKTPEEQADPLSLLEEALVYEPSAIRHIELAELLAAAGRKEEAERYLRRARCMAPRHPLPARWLQRR